MIRQHVCERTKRGLVLGAAGRRWSRSSARVRFSSLHADHAGARLAADRPLSARSPAAVQHLQLNGLFDDRLIGQPTLLSWLPGAGYGIGYSGKWHLPREGDGELWEVERWPHPASGAARWHGTATTSPATRCGAWSRAGRRRSLGATCCPPSAPRRRGR